jgi:hypothetical protein
MCYLVVLLQFQLFCLRLWNADLFTGCDTLSPTCCFPPSLALSLSLSTAPAVSTSEYSAIESQLKFTSEVLTCYTLYNYCVYYLTLLFIYERLNILKIDLAF